MKKTISIALLLLCLVAPIRATGQEPASTPLRFGTAEVIYAIDAEYSVLTEHVASIDVVFAPELGYAAANFVNGKLKISIASAEPIDLSGTIAEATATLSDQSKAAPELELTGLRFNGLKAKENLVATSVRTSLTGGTLSVNISAHNDYLNNAYVFLVGAYSGEGQPLAIASRQLVFENKDESISVALPNCGNAEKVKVFYLSKTYTPVLREAEIPIK